MNESTDDDDNDDDGCKEACKEALRKLFYVETLVMMIHHASCNFGLQDEATRWDCFRGVDGDGDCIAAAAAAAAAAVVMVQGIEYV